MNTYPNIKTVDAFDVSSGRKQISFSNMLRSLQSTIIVVLFAALFYVIGFSFEFSLATRYSIVVAICILLTVFTRGQFVYELRFSRYTALWMLLLLSMFIALTISNGLYDNVLDFILIYILYIVVVSRGMFRFDNNGYTILSAGLIIAADLIIYRSLSEVPLTATMYRGLMTNPNSLGGFLVAPLTGALFLLCTSESRMIKAISIGELILFAYVLYCTSCRSALVAFVVTVALVLAHTFNASTKGGSVKRHISRMAIITGSILIILFYGSQLLVLIRGNVYKWGTAVVQGDLSSGRVEMWRYVIGNVPFFGWGDVLVHCHNDFILWLEQYGWASAMMLLAMLALFFIAAIRQHVQFKSFLTLFNIIFILDFILVASFEEIMGMFGKPLVVMMFIALGNVVTIHNKSLREHIVTTR